MKRKSHHAQRAGHHSGATDRGVTRHSMEHKPEHETDMDARRKMLEKHHHATLWIYWSIIVIGFWLIATPLTFGYEIGTVEPAGGRSVWLSLQARIAILTWSDLISGLLLIIFGYRSLKPNRPVSLWSACFVGIWLNFAPLLFWAPSAVTYLNDTLAGTLVIALTILIPGMPNMVAYMKMGPDTPPGWSYNPSSWPQRSVLIALGFAGWLVSRYLAAFQMGYIDRVWDPFFGDGSREVLTSSMSQSVPVSDGGLGALAYTFEFLMVWMGGVSRWRTMPWMVALFGILVIPLGLVHIFLVISQPVAVGAWCSFCLLAAAIMLPMIPLEADEVIAMLQFMKKSLRAGKPFWRTFWKGDTIEGGPDERTPGMAAFPDKPSQVFKASLWGMSFPGTLILTGLLGIWLMATPALLGNTDKVAAVNHLAGALIVTFSFIAMAEPLRGLRFLNMLLAIAVLASSWVLSGGVFWGTVGNVVASLAVFGLSFPRGTVRESYGDWNSLIV
jgi:hypothetical protein